MSLSLDFSQIWEQAADFTNNLWPIMVIPLGMILGVGILGFIMKTVKGALSSFQKPLSDTRYPLQPSRAHQVEPGAPGAFKVEE